MTMNLKLDWNDEVEADENGDDYVNSSESVDGRFDITPNWYDSDKEKPVDFTLRDNTTKKNITTQRSAAACKKAAVEIINRPPPKVWTHDELVQNAANAYHMNIASSNERTRNWAERDAAKASTQLGVDVRTIPMADAFKAQIAKMMGAQS
jgi:hypothetical protein